MTQILLYTNEDLKNDLVELTRQMAKDGFCPNVIIGPGRGAYIPGVMLSHFYNVPFEGFTWQTRDGDTRDESKVVNAVFPYFNKTKILIVDDVNDSGKTLAGITEAINTATDLWQGAPPVIKIATLFNKEQSHFDGVDYYAQRLTLDYDPWIIFPYEVWWKK